MSFRKLFDGCLNPNNSPRCITILYIAFGALWILLSDRVTNWLVADRADLAIVQTSKGLLYIGITAFLVHWLSVRTVAFAAHRAAKRELESTRKLLERTLASLGEAVIVVDPDSRTILQCNPAAQQVFGYRESELVGQRTAILHLDEESHRRFSEIGEPALHAQGTFRTEYPMKRKDGTVIHTEISVNTLEEDLGWKHGVISVVRDISESVRLRLALEERMKELRALFETTRCLAHVEHPFERRLADLLEIIPAGWQFPEKTAARLTFDDLAIATPNFRETAWMQSSPIRRFETVMGQIDVALLEAPAAPGAVPFLEEEQTLLDNIARAVGETAERKRLEEQYQQAQKLESVGRLAGGVAHDFNNMLSVILGNCDMALAKLEPGAPLRFECEEILKAGRRAAELTQQLLAFSRQEVARPVILDLNREIESLASMLKRMVTEDIKLDLDLGPDPSKVRLDPGQAHQILANLVVNARDAISGSGAITITTRRQTLDAAQCASMEGCSAGDYVVLTVADTGAGMDAVTKDKVFEPFFTTKPEGKGTGLGLAMVYGIVRQNRGAVRLESALGQGSTFYIYLPFDVEDIQTTPRPGARIGEHRGTETILLVEDEEQILRLNTRMIENMGYTVLSANSPSRALQFVHAREHSIDLLITDVVMPEMNGRELYEAIVELRPGTKCLFTSGYTADVIAERGILEENVHFLQKPFSRKELGIRIRETLDA